MAIARKVGLKATYGPRHFKSRTYRRVQVRIKTGTVQRFKRRKPNYAHCGKCGAKLYAIPRLLPYQLRKLPKVQRRPERPLPHLCVTCQRATILEKNL